MPRLPNRPHYNHSGAYFLMVDYKLYATFTDEELANWRKLARRNYKPGSYIHPAWKPPFIEECMLMNTEVGFFGRPIAEVCHV